MGDGTADGTRSLFDDYMDARSYFLWRIIGWTLLVLILGGLTLAFYLNAQQAADNPFSSDEDRTYYVLWGPMAFGAWKAIQAGLGLRRLNALYRSRS